MALLSPLRRMSVAVAIVMSLGFLPGCGGESAQTAPPPPVGSTPPPPAASTPVKGQPSFGSDAATDTTLDPRYK